MKPACILFSLIYLFSCSAFAQQKGVNDIRKLMGVMPWINGVHESMTTNAIRSVGANVYHVWRSQIWESLGDRSKEMTNFLSGLPMEYDRHSLKVISVEPDLLLCRELNWESTSPNRGYWANGSVIAIRNHPLRAKVLSDETLYEFRALRIGRTNWSGDTIALYDYGLPATAPVIAPAPKK